ncbi:histidine--tRNA ligase [Candidatus Gromoviella agglomerans]|uniref:histidine--tRNA ligase n=1 Tax=Candidatus Gromoviella agglomerans TaxID=2806609 RepID=UPI001E5392B1|nr:histidine--tRNA ligase [Candidatus Gromoviella agglomerans]UFX98220.1 Histidine--tRNA ligase [Candidatus Gromoviella agglomerans]
MLRPIRGTKDFSIIDCQLFNTIISQMKSQMNLYNIDEISVPIFEHEELFSTSVGELSDIVQREMYKVNSNNLKRESSEKVVLRPESTTSVMRFISSNNLIYDMPKRFFTYGPMFRYERPQKGRLRQMNQFSVELLGYDSSFIDAELIKCAQDCLNSIGINPYRLEINTLGDVKTRENYRQILINYYEKHINGLSNESKNKMYKNPLRIFDSKFECDQEIINDAPKILEYLSYESRKFFEKVMNYLSALSVDFCINDKLVRGLDYYSDTVFEFKIDSFGAQSTILAGGRYDSLSQKIISKKIPAVGWSLGIDRAMMMIEESYQSPQKANNIGIVVFADENDTAMKEALIIATKIRRIKLNCEIISEQTLSKCLKMANNRNISICVILGPEEVSRQECIVKNMQKSETQLTISTSNIEQEFISIKEKLLI